MGLLMKIPSDKKHEYCQVNQVHTPKRNIHAQKMMLLIWWSQEGTVYHELLKPGEMIRAVR